MRRRQKCTLIPAPTEPDRRLGKPCNPKDPAATERLEIRPPAAVSIGTQRKGRGGRAVPRTARSLFSKGVKAQSERQTNKATMTGRPQESILFSALSGLKDGVHLRVFFNKKVEGGRKNVFLFAARPFNGFPIIEIRRLDSTSNPPFKGRCQHLMK